MTRQASHGKMDVHSLRRRHPTALRLWVLLPHRGLSVSSSFQASQAPQSSELRRHDDGEDVGTEGVPLLLTARPESEH